MCGIAGIYNLTGNGEITREQLNRMISLLQHRGPDGNGTYVDRRAGLAHARLSIIDVEGGGQPMQNEDGTIWITFNGEIFNYVELRPVLESKGHRFSTHSDTEVIIHLYEEYGPDCLKYLNGQFAFAIWDLNRERLFAARDRVGIRPFFYTTVDGQFLFASEIKALFTDSRIPRELDVFALDQIFTFWMTISPRTAFTGIYELPAGHYCLLERGELRIHEYWDPDFTAEIGFESSDDCAEALKELLIDATRLQLRSDVPVGAYLSGGLDSSVITALIKNYTDTPLRTFSVSFTDANYDESVYQRQMIEHLGTNHSDIRCDAEDIGRVFPDVIWHGEKPILRTAPAPLFLLSKLVRESGYKVVLTGEGSDEVLAGYDIFKEVKIRKFLERAPRSAWRPLILKRLYPYLANSPVRSLPYAEAFFRADRSDYPEIFQSHATRWSTTSKTRMFFSPEMRHKLQGYSNIEELKGTMTAGNGGSDPLSQAQYLEIKTLLSGYLLSSQGDRVAMAHSIEGRFPFLDHRVIEFCCKLPPTLRMRGLTEKYALRKSMRNILPEPILTRTKQPYMAPDAQSFTGPAARDYVGELLSERNLRETGFFDPKAVAMLRKKCSERTLPGFKDNMAFVGILSTLLAHELFVKQFSRQLSGAEHHQAEGGHHAVAV
jgi:asparagine synthase (glutamine-hydrolysing)